MSKHKFKSIDGAVRRIRQLEKRIDTDMEILERFDQDRRVLAKLAAKGPCFTNPLEVYAAENIRDQILARLGLNPDGSFINKGTPCQT